MSARFKIEVEIAFFIFVSCTKLHKKPRSAEEYMTTLILWGAATFKYSTSIIAAGLP